MFEHSIKNIYIWQYYYTIDLQDTSAQDITSKWWNIYRESVSISNTDLTYYSDWICNGVVYKQFDISEANKVTIESYVYIKNATSWWMATNTITWTIGTDTQYLWLTWWPSSYTTEWLYVTFNDWTKTSAGAVSTGRYNVTMTVDLLTWVVNVTNGTLTATKTLSSSELSTLKTYGYIGARAYAWNSNVYSNRLQKVTITIE